MQNTNEQRSLYYINKGLKYGDYLDFIAKSEDCIYLDSLITDTISFMQLEALIKDLIPTLNIFSNSYNLENNNNNKRQEIDESFANIITKIVEFKELIIDYLKYIKSDITSPQLIDTLNNFIDTYSISKDSEEYKLTKKNK